MKKSLLVLVAVLVISVTALTACGGGAAAPDNGAAAVTVPAEYAGKINPVAGDAAAAAAGAEIYTTYCSSCHGDTGLGDGPAGASLDPAPGNLQTISEGDDYVYWRIAEGGMMEPFNSNMPAWKGQLTEEQIWQLVAHIRTLK